MRGIYTQAMITNNILYIIYRPDIIANNNTYHRPVMIRDNYLFYTMQQRAWRGLRVQYNDIYNTYSVIYTGTGGRSRPSHNKE